VSLRHLLAPLTADAPVVRAGALALLCTYAFFVGAPAWNQNSRFALTRALVEDRSARIDRFHETTGDKAFAGEHWYTDKAPGTSWLAAPAYAAFYAVRRVTGGELPMVRVRPLDPRAQAAGRFPSPSERLPGDRLVYNNGHRVALWLCTVFAVGLLGVIGSAAAYLLAWHRSGDRRVARRVALTLGLATPVLPYATSLYGHVPCGALLFAAFAIVMLGPGSRALAIAAGACAGVAVTAEYPAALPAALVWALGLRRHGMRFSGWMLAGAALPALLLAIYHATAFGHPLRTGYDFVVGDEFSTGMAVHYGIASPRARVVLEILFGSYRGLFYLSPVLLLAVWGLVHDVVHGDGERRTIAAFALSICTYYVLLNAGYYMWDGGAAAGPRHVVPMLGFLALGLPAAIARVPWAFAVLAIVSAAQMLLLAAATPEAPRWGDPIWEYAVGSLVRADPGPSGSATNLGRLLGLPGALSLLPLVAPWAWARAVARDHAQKRPDSESPAFTPS
jgi:hypothetical protein